MCFLPNSLKVLSQFVNSLIEVFLKLTGFILNVGSMSHPSPPKKFSRSGLRYWVFFKRLCNAHSDGLMTTS